MVRRSLRSWLWGVPLEQEVDEELAFHREMRARENGQVHRQTDTADVRRTLLIIGRKRDREMRLTQWLEEIGTDVRFALRQMRRAPGFTAVAVVTLALGIGANGAIFALADGVLLRPLPFPGPERLVTVEEWGPGEADRSRIELLNFHEWQRDSRTIASMAAVWVPAGDGGASMIGLDGAAETVAAQTVSPAFFDTLGVRPILGRTFAASDDGPDPVAVVLSEGFWKRRFGGDPAIVGRTIAIDERPHTVIGVVPDSFEFIRPESIWRLLPLPRTAAGGFTRGQCGVCRYLMVIARLQPGASPDMARTELTGIADALAERNGRTDRPRRVVVTPLRDVVLGRDLRLTAVLFLGVVGLLLLLCCANVANLVLVKASARQRELAVRGALGAGSGRLAAQLLTENLTLAVLGAIVGLGLAAAILAVAPAVVPPGLLPGVVTLAVDARVVAFCGLCALAVGTIFGLAPVAQVRRLRLGEAVAFDPRTPTRRGRWSSRVLVGIEVAATVIVLCGAGLLLRTLLILDGFDPGYHASPAAVVTTEISVSGSRYPASADLQRFFDAVGEQLRAIPGVRSVAWGTTPPLGDSTLGGRSFQIVGEPPAPPESQPQADVQVISPSYFATLDLPIVAGRAFTDADRAGSAPVAIVSEAFARRYLSGRPVLGTRVSVSVTGVPIVREIVGVARQVKGAPDEGESFAQIYVPTTQGLGRETNLIVRADTARIGSLLPSIRQAVARVDRLQSMKPFLTLEDIANAATARPRFRTALVMTLAAVALLLAMVGVFGVLAYSVQQRRREFGVRLAIGATARDVRTLVFSEAGRVVGAGAAAGLAGALLLGQSVSTFLFGVRPQDPITFGAVAIVVVVTAALAAALPAWRASRTDPSVVFRDI